MSVQNFGIIESNLSTGLNVVIDSLLLLFSLMGQKVAQLKIFITSNIRSGVNFTSHAEVDVWSLLLLLVISGQKEIGLPLWVLSHKFRFWEETSSGVVFKFHSLSCGHQSKQFHL